MEFCGVANDFFVVSEGDYFRTYDENSHKIAELWNPHGKMTFKNAAGGNFNIKEGDYIRTYDKDCKKTAEKWVP
jgi:hypothetical protein